MVLKSKKLSNILAAKDKRSQKRDVIISSNRCSISLSLNIPGYPKVDDSIRWFYNYLLVDLKDFLLANRIFVDENDSFNIEDEAGCYYLVPLVVEIENSIDVKNKCENFEGNHVLGRFIDVDVSDSKGVPVSSGKMKLCFYCKEKPAVICMRENNHTIEELRDYITKEIDIYRNTKKKFEVINKLSSFALRSVLHEISLTPKPGLVDSMSSGSHNDMDYCTFIDSTSSIAIYFNEFAKLGWDNNDIKNDSEALPIIRKIGLFLEKEMFVTVNGVNTQKGVIFLMGLSLYSAARTIFVNGFFNQSYFIDLVKRINHDIVEKELSVKNKKNKTHGEKCYELYGRIGAGARMEVQLGFPSVFENGLSILEKKLNGRTNLSIEEINPVLTEVLLSIMSVNNDSNILYRGGIESLKKIQEMSYNILKNTSNDLYSTLSKYCEEKKLSPGGSADLLSVTLFIYYVKNFFHVDRI